jgi:hypothetical protein
LNVQHYFLSLIVILACIRAGPKCISQKDIYLHCLPLPVITTFQEKDSLDICFKRKIV